MANQHARRLHSNMTDAERKLWQRLRFSMLGHRFRRQHPLGTYVVDFICLDRKLVIELDGGQHNMAPGIAHDARRTAWLNGRGYEVIRFWNADVMSNIDGVLETILAALERRPPTRIASAIRPPPQGGR